jgi:hypothetical protein
MATWTDYAALIASLASGKAFTDEKAQALAENLQAYLETDATAPVNQACWHPYDMVFANDGAIGRFYNGTVTTSVAVPTMVAGYDYMFRGQGLRHSAGTNQGILINGFTVDSNTYPSATTLSFGFELHAPAIANWPKRAQNTVFRVSTGADNQAFVEAQIRSMFNLSTALTTFNFTVTGGNNLFAGQIFMYRRRNYMP